LIEKHISGEEFTTNIKKEHIVMAGGGMIVALY
jgi:hypothetical protein